MSTFAFSLSGKTGAYEAAISKGTEPTTEHAGVDDNDIE